MLFRSRVIEGEALKMIEASLQKGPKRGPKTEITIETTIVAEVSEAA